MRITTRFSLLTLLVGITVLGVALTTWRWLSPPPVYSIAMGRGSGTYYSHAFDRSFAVTISDAVMMSSPKWTRQEGNPPLNANSAMVIADKVRLQFIEQGKLHKSEEWAMVSAELTPYDEANGQWFWMIRFQGLRDQSGPPVEFLVPVLMDGRVITPQLNIEEGAESDFEY